MANNRAIAVKIVDTCVVCVNVFLEVTAGQDCRKSRAAEANLTLEANMMRNEIITVGRRVVFPGLLLLGWLVPMVMGGAQGETHVPQLNRDATAGQQVKVAAICIGFGGNREKKLALALEHLDTAGKNGVDIACLPEEFAGTEAEPLDGPIVQAVAELAKKYNMYVICPIREQAGDKEYNTAVLIDRKGNVAGYYRKVFVFWGEGVHCSTEGVKVFDTDFGRISMLTCFDLNFSELWQRCDELGAEIVFWPSAYGGGSPLNAHAILHHYYIVPVGAGNIMDITGKEVAEVQKPVDKQFIATLDLDRAFAHYDFNREKVAKMLKECAGKIEVERNLSEEDLAPWWLFRAVKPGVHVREVLKKYGIETLRDYQRRSRVQINKAREEGERI